MNVKNIFSILTGLVVLLGLAACEDEKELITIEGNLPIKTSTLYMVGDATPNGWSIDAPTPLNPTEEDPLVFTWEGALNAGEMKLCLTTGSWDSPFIRPVNANEPLGKGGIAETAFAMHAGDPDDKWKVTDAGIYSLRFDLRNWKMQADYVRELDPVVIEPIVAENVYIVGDATPTGWSIDEPTALEKKSDYIFVYEGTLDAGEFKACTETGSWDVPFIRPEADAVEINAEGVASENFVYTASPDHKWKVTQPGIYRITLDLEHWTITAEYTGEYTPAAKLYMIGEATDGGWSWDAATVIEAADETNTLFVWEGELGRGSFKAAMEKDFSAPFYRPEIPNCEVSASGVASDKMVYTTDPDDQWLVTAAGRYRLTFNIADMTFNAEYLSAVEERNVLYMIGEATEGGWSWDAATEIEADAANEAVFVWEGDLKAGTLKAAKVKDFSAPFYRPATPDCEISASGVASNTMVFTTDPDDQWKVVAAGRYRLTFDTEAMTFDAVCISGGEVEQPAVLYMIGEATAGGWSWDAATEIQGDAANKAVFVWEGDLKAGTFKAAREKDFSAPFYRPATPDCEISASGVASNTMVFTTDPDDQWKVVAAGRYRLTFDTEAMTFNAVCISGGKVEEPVPPLYLIGDATPGGWSLDNATEITSETKGLYVWEGLLNKGEFKASLVKDFSAPFYRPTVAGCEVSASGVANRAMVFTTDPDDKWKVTAAGRYRLTFNTEAMTFDAQFLEAVATADPLYILGDATPGGWSQDDAAELTPVEGREGVYTWTGKLVKGTMKAFVDKDPTWSQNFYRPTRNGVRISRSGVEEAAMVFTASPDDQWKIEDEGNYTLTLDIKNMTIQAKFNN